MTSAVARRSALLVLLWTSLAFNASTSDVQTSQAGVLQLPAEGSLDLSAQAEFVGFDESSPGVYEFLVVAEVTAIGVALERNDVTLLLTGSDRRGETIYLARTDDSHTWRSFLRLEPCVSDPCQEPLTVTLGSHLLDPVELSWEIKVLAAVREAGCGSPEPLPDLALEVTLPDSVESQP